MRRGNSFRCDETQSPADLASQSPSGRQDNATPPSCRARQNASECKPRDENVQCHSRKTEARVDDLRQSPRMLKATQTEGLISRSVLLLQRPYVFLPVIALVFLVSTQQLLQGYSVSSLPLQRVILGKYDFQSATEADVSNARVAVLSSSHGFGADEAAILPRVKQLLEAWEPRRPPSDVREDGRREGGEEDRHAPDSRTSERVADESGFELSEGSSGLPRAPHLVDCALHAKVRHATQARHVHHVMTAAAP